LLDRLDVLLLEGLIELLSGLVDLGAGSCVDQAGSGKDDEGKQGGSHTHATLLEERLGDDWAGLQSGDLEQPLNPFPVTPHQRFVDEGARRQGRALEASLQLGDKGS
jgi:hypothetical protein